jgi:hypothetical protein
MNDHTPQNALILSVFYAYVTRYNDLEVRKKLLKKLDDDHGVKADEYN